VIEETKNNIVFTTERVICSLRNVFDYFKGLQEGANFHDGFFGRSNDCTATEMEISRAFLHITEALQYLHNVQRKLHLNLTPESIVLTASGRWKVRLPFLLLRVSRLKRVCLIAV
jgi:serine/threonine protein kinase